jgi:hypothetical protein
MPQISEPDPNSRHRRAGRTPGKTDSAAPTERPRAVSLGALTEVQPKFKSAQIGLLWPEIKEAIAGGHKLRQIWERLGEDGIHLSYSKFRYYIARLKRIETSGKGAAPPSHAAQSVRKGADPVSPAHDPLANLRDRLSKRPGFEFDERPPDIKKLI